MLENTPHDITGMVVEFDDPNTGIDIPQHTSHVTRGGEDLSVIQESAA